jgi:pimeloyl-ACP methyl ester carboxylesterase
MFQDRVHPAPLFGYIAPFLNQARAVAWERLKHYCRPLPDVRINETETAITLWNRAVIRLFGADHPDRLRGLGFDGVVMDEVAQMKPDTWNAVVRPALSDRRGWAVFIGTPKGRNVFHQLYNEALGKEDWFAGLYPADRTGVISAEETACLQTDMPPALYGQEYLCDFTAANADSFIDFMAVHEAAKRETPVHNPAPLVFGLDVARFGDDRTVLIQRRGRVLEDILIRRGQDLMRTASETAEAINRRRPQAVFVDAVGLGAGVVDRLRQLGHRVLGINSGSKALNPDKFVNLKAEMWSKMRDWLAESAVIPDRPELRDDLLAPRYDFDHAGRLKIESKDDLKERVRFSTDLADALALTFAQPVALARREPREQRFYDRD